MYTILDDFYDKQLEHFTFNCAIHDQATRHRGNLNLLQSHLLLRQKGVHYLSINIFNSLPTYVRYLVQDGKQFIGKLKGNVINNSFYSVDEIWLYSQDL
jgi:hypothetical protein